MGSDMGVQEKGRKIVVAVDESEESMRALSWCLKNIIVGQSSSQSHHQLVLLHAIRPTVVFPGLDNSALVLSHDVLSSLDRRDRDMALWVIQKAEKLCKDYDVKAECRVEDGDPRDVICEMVNVLGADLLVMGSHGYGLITRSIIGSVSNHCVQHASCPVLVVKKPRSTTSDPGIK